MNIRVLVLGFIIVVLFVAVSYSITRALFLDTASATGNTFTAAEVFPEASPSATPTASVTPSTEPTPDSTGLASHIVISEVQIATSGATTSDFVELYNPTSVPINLDDFHLVKRTQTGTSSASLKAFAIADVIPAHGFYLWASSDGGYAQQINANVSTVENIASNNSIALLDSSDSIVDAVAWGIEHTAPLIEGTAISNPPGNQSIERKALTTSTQGTMEGGADVAKGNGFDAGNNSTDFILRTVSQPQNSGSGTEAP